MTFWIDAQLNPDLPAWLGVRFGVIAKALREIGLRDEDDVVIFDAARRFGPTVIVTKDEDFVELVHRRGAPPQVVWLRCGNLTTLELQVLLSRRFAGAIEALNRGDPVVEIAD